MKKLIVLLTLLFVLCGCGEYKIVHVSSVNDDSKWVTVVFGTESDNKNGRMYEISIPRNNIFKRAKGGCRASAFIDSGYYSLKGKSTYAKYHIKELGKNKAVIDVEMKLVSGINSNKYKTVNCSLTMIKKEHLNNLKG